MYVLGGNGPILGQIQVEKGSVEQMHGMTFSRNEQFLGEIASGFNRYGQAKVLEVGDGLVAIQWSDDENFAIFFDTGRWRLALPIEDRYKTVVFPSKPRNTGVITTYFLRKELKTPEVVKALAKLMLVPTASHYRLVSEK